MAEWGSTLYRTPYLVLPRLAIEAMPEEWQNRLEALLKEAEAAGLETPSYYVLRDKAEPGCDPFVRGLKDVSQDPLREFLRFDGRHAIADPWANYRHGKVEDLCPSFKRGGAHG